MADASGPGFPADAGNNPTLGALAAKPSRDFISATMTKTITTAPRKSAPAVASTAFRTSLDSSATPTRATATAAIRLPVEQPLHRAAGWPLRSRISPRPEQPVLLAN